MKYIDAEKLKEIINKTWRELSDKNVKIGGGILDAEIYTYLSVLNLIDSLQQESIEADLEKEIDKRLINIANQYRLGKYRKPHIQALKNVLATFLNLD